MWATFAFDKRTYNVGKNNSDILLEHSLKLLRGLYYDNLPEDFCDRIIQWFMSDDEGKREIKDRALEMIFAEIVNKNVCPNSKPIDIYLQEARDIIESAEKKESCPCPELTNL